MKSKKIIKAKPFLKWVGGKGSLIPELMKHTPSEFNNYYEPFLGGGAFFFALNPSKKSYLNDINSTLISTFENIRDNREELIEKLGLLEEKYLSLNDEKRKEFYYEARKKFNQLKDNPTSLERSIYLIFLNKTCFNGMYRENSKGDFNVPSGKYKNPKILDDTNLRMIAERLHKDVIFTQDGFEEAVKNAKKGDFVYFDPPYYPVNKTSSFTSYNENNFLEEEQIKLRDCVSELSSKGVKVMLSNSYTQFILDIYKDFRVETVQAPRFINSKSDKRGKIKEVLVMNYGKEDEGIRG